MSEVLRLIGLTQDGAGLTVLLAAVIVWMTMSVRQLRNDVDGIKRKADDNAEAIAALRTEVHDIATNVAVLRDRADRPAPVP